eukprot:11213_1
MSFCFFLAFVITINATVSVSRLINNKNVSAAQIMEFETIYGAPNNEHPIRGFEPSSAGTYPLFIWIGSTVNPYWMQDDQRYVNYTAQHNIVSVSVSYPNVGYPLSCNGMVSKADAIFNLSDPRSALSVLCAKQNVDCINLGVIVAGYSQGANLVSLAANFGEDMIKGVYEMSGGDNNIFLNADLRNCLSYDTLYIDSSNIRSCIGEWDRFWGSEIAEVRKQQISITGYECGDTISDCIQNDGSGWYIVVDSEAQKNAGHCYAYSGILESCGYDFTPMYYQGCQMQCKWSFESNLQWLINKLN